MKLYLDDVRPAPDGWRLVHDVQTCLAMLRNFPVDELSLDHDLAAEATGMDVLNWLESHATTTPTYLPPYIKIHTMNGAVRAKMQQVALKLNRLRQERL